MKKIYPLILLSISFNAFSQEIHPHSVDEYALLLKEIRNGKKTEQTFVKKLKTFYSRLTNNTPADKNSLVENAYAKGVQATHDLSEPLGNNENEIDSKWLQEMRTKLEGFNLNPNTETYVASPKLDFFNDLSKKYGSPADVAYFTLALKTLPSNSYFPAYIHQETDLSGCTVYDGTLTTLHHDWIQFQKTYSHSYKKNVKSYLEDIEKNLSDSKCFCDKTTGPILKELESFVQKNPKLSITAKIKKRISDINSKKIPIPGCNY